METNKDIQNKIDEAFNAIDAIETVNVPPFFKDKTMQLLFAEKEETTTVWSWFTPKWQLASLVVIIALNIVALNEVSTSKYDESIDDFAQAYGLNSTSETTLLYQIN